ncbi:uncharacterized protein TNCT_373011, partial [Trichonephila clavata]
MRVSYTLTESTAIDRKIKKEKICNKPSRRRCYFERCTQCEMQEWVLVLTVLGVIVGLIFAAVVLWKLLGGWSRINSCVKGDREETAQLTKNGHFGANGYV